MAWEPCHDDHAIFLMKRFGVRKVEVLPTKYSAWDSFFAGGGAFSKKFADSGIEVYSLQSLLYGVEGDFLNNSDSLRQHLKNVICTARDMGCKILVLGSPRTRVEGLSEESLRVILDDVQDGFTDVHLCLEPNSRAYGCHIGTDISSVLRITRGSSFFANLDTGNAAMSGSAVPMITSNKIVHVQVSAPFLGPMLDSSYAQLNTVGMTDYISGIVGGNADVCVSLEVNLGAPSIQMLGAQIRGFCQYNSASFGSFE